MKFELENTLRGTPDKELLDELRRCAKEINRKTITMVEFEEHGKCHPSTIQRRFGSWVNALKLAELEPSRSKIGITDEELFENIEAMWTSLGRQPQYGEVKSPDSEYSVGTYENRFGTWSDARRAFVEWVNSDDSENTLSGAETNDKSAPKQSQKPIRHKRRTRREISLRQRFRILLRNDFRCMACGASPAKQAGVELHVDHIVPWSKGGETTDDNLECKCSKCNLGKGNAFNV